MISIICGLKKKKKKRTNKTKTDLETQTKRTVARAGREWRWKEEGKESSQ